MSWFNGQIFRQSELLAANGMSFGTKYGFGHAVNVWIDLGESWYSVPGIVCGINIGANGRIQYKVAVELANAGRGMGLYSGVLIEGEYLTPLDVITFDGPSDVNAEAIRNLVGKKPALFGVPTPGYEVKGIHIKREAFSCFDKLSIPLGDAVHKAIVASVQNWMERNGTSNFGEIIVRKDEKFADMIYVDFNGKLAVISVSTLSFPVNAFRVKLYNKREEGRQVGDEQFGDGSIDNIVPYLIKHFCPKM